MALPKIQLPKYKIKLLTSEREIYIRPFTVKEEKILLMAAESNNTAEITTALLQIIDNCVLEENFKIENMPFFEVIYLFLNIKKISSGEEINIMIKENEKQYDAYCNLNNDIILENLEHLDKFNKPIKIENNDIYIKIKPLTYKDYIQLSKSIDGKTSEIQIIYNALLLSIDEIYDGQSSYNPNEFTLKELSEFYEDIPSKTKNEIQNLYKYSPSLKLKFHYQKEGQMYEKIINNITPDFFAL